jgi:hypothetical protein
LLFGGGVGLLDSYIHIATHDVTYDVILSFYKHTGGEDGILINEF